MTFIKFRYITKDRDRHGNVRLYFRRPGKSKVRLPGLPGSEEFLAAYKAALNEHDPSKAKAEKSFEWLCDRYYKSTYFQSLEDYTQRRKRAGVLESYNDLLGTSEPLTVAKFLLAIVREKVRGHWPCPCGSGEIIRKCHRDAVERLQSSPRALIAETGCMIFDSLKKQRNVG